MSLKRISLILGIIISCSVILGGGWKFYECKADRVELQKLASNFNIYKLEQYRRYVQERIWAIERNYPTTFRTNIEWQRLTQELKQIDMKLNAYYRKGK